MITKNIDGFGDNYSQLFANASKALRAAYKDPNNKDVTDSVYENIDIQSLEQYFAHLNTLYKLSAKVLEDENGDIIKIHSGKTYGILPLQEPIIPIDANSRKIEIPKEMQNIGVAGDFGAEILYFAIDRYFDNHDLADNDIITAIEWSNPNVTQGNKRGTQKAYTTLTDIPSYLQSGINNLTGPKVLIGWALGGDVMSAAGTIEFAIRFYHLNNDEVRYSWSTQPATLTVNKTLHYDLTDDIDDSVNSIVSDRISNMTSSGTSGLLNAPSFFIDLNIAGREDDQSIVTDYTPKDGKYYIDIPNGQSEYIATVAAKSGTYECNYSWQYHNIDANVGYNNVNSEDYGDNYKVVTTDMSYDDLILYVETDNGYEKASDIDETHIAAGKVFYRVSECKINKPGYYKARALIRTSTSSVKTESHTLVVPGPSVPVIENVANNAQTLDNNGYISVILSDENIASLSVKVVDNSQDLSNITSYSWNKHNSANSYNTSAIPVGDYIGFEGNTNADLNLNECGWYKISAKNVRNNSEPSAASNEIYYRVTHKAQPIYIYQDLDRNIQAGPNAIPAFIVSAQDNNNNDILFDRIEVQWYKQDSADKNTDPKKGSLKTYFPSDFKDGKLQIAYLDQVTDGYTLGQMAYAKIVTYYNNDSATQNTSVITFVTFVDQN